ncbi:hypothetical protein DK26_20970 [Bosea sp. WAO]|nr:hypothetical protein DK26_20970 [Bosea sp. WAO]
MRAARPMISCDVALQAELLEECLLRQPPIITPRSARRLNQDFPGTETSIFFNDIDPLPTLGRSA